MSLIASLEAGRYQDFGLPDHTIDTLLSKVFFFGERVIKVYKHKDAFYGNLAEPNFRRVFIPEDFFWNHAMAPNIYTSIQGVKKEGDRYAVTEEASAEDFFIEMRKVDSSCTLTNLLAAERVSPQQLRELVRFMVPKLRELTELRRESLRHYFEIPWQDLNQSNLEDLRAWAYMAPQIPRSRVDEIVDELIRISRLDAYLTHFHQQNLSAAIDANGDNLLLLSQGPSCIDIMPPKEGWRVNDEYFTITRVAVDAGVFGGSTLSEAVYAAYRDFREDIPPLTRVAYEIRSAMIQWAYREVLSQPVWAEKYRAFSLKKFEELRSLV